MRYFPINLDLTGKEAVIIGGGSVACRKCLRLLAAGAKVRLVAPTLTPTLTGLASQGKIEHVARRFLPDDLGGAAIVFAATDDGDVNRQVAAEACSRSILADIADSPQLGSFTSPALLVRGDLVIAVSTSGRSPALARAIRDELRVRYGPEYGTVVEIIGAVREKLLTEKGNSAYNKSLLNVLIDQHLPELLRQLTRDDTDRLLLELFGPGFSLADLGVRVKDPA